MELKDKHYRPVKYYDNEKRIAVIDDETSFIVASQCFTYGLNNGFLDFKIVEFFAKSLDRAIDYINNNL